MKNDLRESWLILVHTFRKNVVLHDVKAGAVKSGTRLARCPEALGTHTDTQLPQLPSSFSSSFILEPQPQEWFSAQSWEVWRGGHCKFWKPGMVVLSTVGVCVYGGWVSVNLGNTLIAIPRCLFPRWQQIQPSWQSRFTAAVKGKGKEPFCFFLCYFG